MRTECERHVNGDVLTEGIGPEQARRTIIASNALWLLALFAAASVLAWPWISGRLTIPWDAKAHFLPQLQFMARSFAQGESPFWLPYVFAGHPQIADPQSLLFSPPFVLLALAGPAPTAWAMDTTLYLFITISAAALMIWLRDKDLHPLACFLAALSFAFGAAMAWRIQHIGQVLSLAYLPFVLLFLERALNRRSVPYGMAAGLAAAFLVLGRDQVALLSIYLLIGLVVHHWLCSRAPVTRMKETLAPLIAGGMSGATVIAIPILLTMLLAADSNRPSIDLEGAGRGSLHPALFFTAFAPDVFGSSGIIGEYWGPPSALWNVPDLYIAQNMGQVYFGALPMLALIWGAVSGAVFEPRARLYTGALAIACVYALGRYTPLFQVIHALVPGVDLYRRPADAVFLIGFLASVLSAFALDRLLASRAPWTTARSLAVAAVLAGAFAAMIGLALAYGKLAVAWPHIAAPAALFATVAALLATVTSTRLPWRSSLITLLALFTVVDLAYSNRPGGATALPGEAYEVLDPATRNDTIARLKARTEATKSDTRRDRVELVGFGFHWPNASETHSLENTLGYNPVRLGLTTQALGAGDTAGLPEQKSFSPLFPSYRSPLADLLGLATIATSAPVEEIDKALKPGDLTLVARTKNGYVYDNPRALPRVLFAADAERTDFAKLLATGAWPSIDFTKTVLLATAASAPPRAPGHTRIVSYRNTEIVLEAESPEGGFAVLNDVWHPWWFASVDGAPAPLLRANVLFRAVEVPPGKHRITLKFEPVKGALKEIGLFGAK